MHGETVKRYRGSFHGRKLPGVKLTSHLHLQPRLRKSATLPPSPNMPSLPVLGLPLYHFLSHHLSIVIPFDIHNIESLINIQIMNIWKPYFESYLWIFLTGLYWKSAATGSDKTDIFRINWYSSLYYCNCLSSHSRVSAPRVKSVSAPACPPIGSCIKFSSAVEEKRKFI